MSDQIKTTAKTPSGVVGIFIDKLGRVVASVSDFDTSGYGGYSLEEAQKMRAERQLSFAVVRAYCSEMIMEGLEDGDCLRIVRQLVRNGATTTFVAVGHESNVK